MVCCRFASLDHCHFDCKLREKSVISMNLVSAPVNHHVIAQDVSIYTACSTCSQFFLLLAPVPQCLAVTCIVPIIHPSSAVQMSRIS